MLSLAKSVSRVTTILLALICAQSLHAQTPPIQYYYDDLGRLVTMVDQFGNVVTYTYDAVGNILSIGRSTVTLGSLAIFDFNPQSGPVGIAVTIRGQGFTATASADTVKFNGTVATVTSATASTLVVTVPVGATTGPISVTVSGATTTSSANFVVSQAPVVSSVSPKSAFFNVTISAFTVTGASLLGAMFSFNPPGPTISGVSINPSGTSATMTVSTGVVEGTFALVATNSTGNSGLGTTEANWFTVVSPTSTELSACGTGEVVMAAYGLDPLNPNDCPTGSSIPLAGEKDGLIFSVLNTSQGTQPVQSESDGVIFSVLNTSQGTQPVDDESDGVIFSVQNNAGQAKSVSTGSATPSQAQGEQSGLPRQRPKAAPGKYQRAKAH